MPPGSLPEDVFGGRPPLRPLGGAPAFAGANRVPVQGWLQLVRKSAAPDLAPWMKALIS